MNEATVDMSLQESCLDAARHLSVEVRLLASKAGGLEAENAELRELAGLLLYGMHHDAPPHEELLWSQKVNRLIDELGIKVENH